MGLRALMPSTNTAWRLSGQSEYIGERMNENLETGCHGRSECIRACPCSSEKRGPGCRCAPERGCKIVAQDAILGTRFANDFKPLKGATELPWFPSPASRARVPQRLLCPSVSHWATIFSLPVGGSCTRTLQSRLNTGKLGCTRFARGTQMR